MKSETKKFKTKNLIFLIVSAFLLVGTTVAWFTLINNSEISNFQSYVGSESSNDVFYEAIDVNHNNILDDGEIYNEIETDEIETFNMIPGQKYFYKVEVGILHQNSNASLIFGNINDKIEYKLSNYLLVEARLFDKSTNTCVFQSEQSKLKLNFADGKYFAKIFEENVLATGSYDVYYTFQLNSDIPASLQSADMSIGSINFITSEF